MAVDQDQDPFVIYMNGKGYMPIILPKGGVAPPMLLSLNEGRYSDTRELIELLASRNLQVDGLASDFKPAADFGKELTNNQKGKVKVGFLDGILSKLGLGADPTIEAHAGHGDQTKYQFQEVSVKKTLPGLIRDRIKNLQPDDFDETDLNKGRVYVAYEYVYAKKLVIGKGNNVAAGFEAKAEIKKVANIEVSAGADGVRVDITAYNGNQPLAIGFRAGQLTRANGSYHFDWNMPVGKGLVAGEPKPLVIKNWILEPAEG